MKIAVVGAGIAGLTAARILNAKHDVTVFERESTAGGNAKTFGVPLDGSEFDVDVGVAMFYRQAYPLFFELMTRLGVELEPLNFSYEVNDLDSATLKRPVFINAGSPHKNLASAFLSGIQNLKPELNRFMRIGETCSPDESMQMTLGQDSFSSQFRLLIVLIGKMVWTISTENLLRLPTSFVVRELSKLDLPFSLRFENWYRVRKGVREYVDCLSAPLNDLRTGQLVDHVRRCSEGVEVCTSNGPELFDQAIFAVPGELALRLLVDPPDDERKMLSVFASESHQVFVTSRWPGRNLPSTDASVYIEVENSAADVSTLKMHSGVVDLPKFYNLEQQSSLFLSCFEQPVDVQTLDSKIQWCGATPVLTPEVISAQVAHQTISGRDRIHYCGAGWGNGLHESGIASALNVTASFGMGMDAIE